jgi:hypothetical protein
MNAPNAKAPGFARSEGLQEHHLPTAAIVAPADESGNAAIDRITDRLELAGFAVRRLDGDAFLVTTKWGCLSRHCPDARVLAGFAEQVGA